LRVILNIFLNLFVAWSSSLFLPWPDQGKNLVFLQILLAKSYGGTDKRKTTSGMETFGRIIGLCYIVFLEVFGATHAWKFVSAVEFAFWRTTLHVGSNTNILLDFFGEVRGLMLQALLGLKLLHFCYYVFIVVHLEHIAN